MLADVKPGAKVADLCARGDKFVEECVPARHKHARHADTSPNASLPLSCSRTHALMPALPAACRETAKVFNKAKTKDGAKVEKGSAFPTCVSLNECVNDAAHAQMIPV